MARFQESLTDRDIRTNVVKPPVDRTAASAIDAIGDAIEAGLDFKDNTTKAKFAEQLGAVSKQEEEFLKDRQEAIGDLQEALSSKDQDALNAAQSKLISLERGERNGVLTPAMARIRRGALLKEQVTSTPWLLPELRSLASVYGGGGGLGGGIEETPEEKAFNKAREQAALTGRTISDVIESANLAAEVQTRENRAKLNFADMQDSVFDQATLSRMELTSKMFTVQQQDPAALDATDWNMLINNEKSRLNGILSNRIKDASKNGQIYSLEQQQRLRQQIEDELAMATDFANSKDKAAFLDKQRKMLDNSTVINLHKMTPAYPKLKAIYGDSTSKFMFSHLKISNEIRQGKTFDQIATLADQGSEDAVMFMEVMKFNAPQIFANISATMGEGGQETRNKYMNAYLKKYAVSVIASPDITRDVPVEKEAEDRAHAELINSGNPKDITAYLRPDVFNKTVMNDKAVSGIANAIEFNLPGILTNIKEDELGKKIIFEDGKFSISKPKVEARSKLAKSFVRKPPEGLIPRNKDVDLLNQYLQLVKKYNIDDATTWTDSVLADLTKEPTVEKERSIISDTARDRILGSDIPREQKLALFMDLGFSEEDANTLLEAKDKEVVD